MPADGPAGATLDDLYRTPGKAELISGRIVQCIPDGHLPNRLAGRICRSLDDYARLVGKAEAFTSTMVFAIKKLASGRESFSPDASCYDGPLPADLMRFIEGPPTFAAEVRSQGDYGEAAEAEMADKRTDYFAAGTKVVWDVDPLAECIHVYKAADPGKPITYRRGQVADAEPAVPGWRVAVDWIFG